MEPLPVTLGGYPDTSDPRPHSVVPLPAVLVSDDEFQRIAKKIAEVALNLSYGTDKETKHFPNDPGTS